MDAASEFMPTFIDDYNRRFGKLPRDRHDAHRAVRKDEDLEAIFAWREYRKITESLLEVTSWQELESQLRSLLARPAEPLESTEYGTKCAIIAPLIGLNGRMAEIVTVWIILAGEETPRFVTAYPKD